MINKSKSDNTHSIVIEEVGKEINGVRVGDCTNLGVVKAIRIESYRGVNISILVADNEKVDRYIYHSVTKIVSNYTKLRRQIKEIVDNGHEWNKSAVLIFRPKRKKGIFDLSRYTKMDFEEFAEKSIDKNFLKELDDTISKFEKSVSYSKTIANFGI